MRSDIVMNAALYLKKAVTVAVRYNAVRRQSNPTRPEGHEMQVSSDAHHIIERAHLIYLTAGSERI